MIVTAYDYWSRNYRMPLVAAKRSCNSQRLHELVCRTPIPPKEPSGQRDTFTFWRQVSLSSSPRWQQSRNSSYNTTLPLCTTRARFKVRFLPHCLLSRSFLNKFLPEKAQRWPAARTLSCILPAQGTYVAQILLHALQHHDFSVGNSPHTHSQHMYIK